jgi:hypothetical protein
MRTFIFVSLNVSKYCSIHEAKDDTTFGPVGGRRSKHKRGGKVSTEKNIWETQSQMGR